jgi:predicted peptidase
VRVRDLLNKLRWFTLLLLAAIVLPARLARADAPASPALLLSIDDKSLPRSPGYHELRGKLQIRGENRGFAFGLFLPRSYFSSTEPMPVVVTLHNGGRSGADGGDFLISEGLGLLIGKDDGQPTSGYGAEPAGAVNLRTDARFICIAPQCPAGFEWSSPELVPMFEQLIGKIVSAYRADPDRVSLTGFSYGGSQTWLIGMEMPRAFAAIIPLDGRATPDPVHDVRKLMDTAIWEAVGGSDEREGFVGFSQQMRDALVLAGHPKFVFRIIPNGSHYCYPAVYRDPVFLDWLYSQRRFGSVAKTKSKTRQTQQLPTTGPAVTSTSYDAPPASGGILCMYWREIPGTSLAELLKNPAFPRYPNQQVYLEQMEIPPNQPGNMATVLRGTLNPPVTGDYTFFIASDNQGELLISKDENRDHIYRIAQVKEWSFPRDWTADPAQQSRPVHLSAGQKYFIEARQKNGSGENHLAVAWKLPDGKFEGPIPGSRLIPATPVVVPPPRVVTMNPYALPTHGGVHQIKLTVEYLARRQTVPVLLVLPAKYPAKNKSPALIYLADTDQSPDPQGWRMAGPVTALSGPLAATSPFIVIAPQCPVDQTWDSLALQRATAAAIQKLLHDLPVDEQSIYLTGSNTGGTAVWQLAPLLATKLAAIAPICGLECTDPHLPAALEGTEIHIITGVKDGMATESANRMKDRLKSLIPPPDVAYEMQMGNETGETEYQKQEFYDALLKWKRPSGKVSQKSD